MNMPSALPSGPFPSFPPFFQENPASAFFRYIEDQFGATCKLMELKRNALVCGQGTDIQYLYLVMKGEITLTRCSVDGGETLLSVLGPGDFFGESALLSRTPVTFSATAAKHSVVKLLPRRKFLALIEDPQASRWLLETIARRCSDAWTQMEVIGCTYAREKVRSGLRWLSGRIGVETTKGVRIDLNQTQLARMIGCARETLSREVTELRRMSAVDIRYDNGRKAFFVLDPENLSEYC